jgi:hypothetical protein|tara:strand:- start:571 stop:738 length:168 start_codon:yes stop_codon:yes gene_type:complete
MAKYISTEEVFRKTINNKKDKRGAVGRVILPGDEIRSVGIEIKPYTTSVTKRQLI